MYFAAVASGWSKIRRSGITGIRPLPDMVEVFSGSHTEAVARKSGLRAGVAGTSVDRPYLAEDRALLA